jgi:ABC-type branched-subunit amino acid transport system substrate-binding protein
MSYESKAEPIKLGYLNDFLLPDSYPKAMRADFHDIFALVFKRGFERGLIDRPVEIIYQEVEGLPKGTIRSVIRAYEAFADEGCLAIFGPHISDNALPMREEIERRFRIPALSVCGAEDWMGEWTFSLPQGSLTDEPVIWAHLMAKRGLKTVGVLVEQSVPGHTYITNFRKAARDAGLSIVAEEMIAQTAQDVGQAVGRLHKAKPDALLHCGFGFGVIFVNGELEKLGWDPPRFMGTAFQNAWINPVMWKGIVGWIGLDNFDEDNRVRTQFLDEYEAAYGRRPQYCLPPMNRDIATLFLNAFADAHPLTPRGVRDALERVKMLPAAAGAPGTRLSFGKYMHRGWVGASYLVARKLDPDGVTSHLVERFGQ